MSSKVQRSHSTVSFPAGVRVWWNVRDGESTFTVSGIVDYIDGTDRAIQVDGGGRAKVPFYCLNRI